MIDLSTLASQADTFERKVAVARLQVGEAVGAPFRAALNSPYEVFREIYFGLLPNYMKPSTATTVEGQQADAARDAQFLKLATVAAYEAFQSAQALLNVNPTP